MNNNMKSTIAAIAITLALIISVGCVKQQHQPVAEKFGWELAKSWTTQEMIKQVREVDRRISIIEGGYYTPSERQNLRSIGVQLPDRYELEHEGAAFGACAAQAQIDVMLEANPSLKGTHSGPQYQARCDASIKQVFATVKAADDKSNAETAK